MTLKISDWISYAFCAYSATSYFLTAFFSSLKPLILSRGTGFWLVCLFVFSFTYLLDCCYVFILQMCYCYLKLKTQTLPVTKYNFTVSFFIK